MELCGWGCAVLVLGSRDPCGAWLGGPRALVGVPGDPMTLCLFLMRGGSIGAGWKAESRLGVGGALDGKGP